MDPATISRQKRLMDPTGFRASDQPGLDRTAARVKEQLERCIRCGLCLPACPTYEVFRTEMDAPRGRLALMSAVWEGRVRPEGAVERHLDLCLGCVACETACPSGVEYGAILQATRERLEPDRSRTMLHRLVCWLAFRQILPRRGWLRLGARLLEWGRRLGLIAVARRARWLPANGRRMAALLPEPVLTYSAPPVAAAHGERRGRVALFRGCIQDAFLGDVQAATVRVLQHNGFEVHFPSGQTCCGAAAHHLADDRLTRELAQRNLGAFHPERFDAIVNNAGGCGAMLKEYAHLFEPETEDATQARRFSEKVQDISEFLAANLGPTPQGRIDARAAYADSCHLRHAQRIVKEPRSLLERIPGLKLVELARPEHCCGSAGVYNISQGQTADKLLDRKMADLAATGPDLIVTTNPGCHLQLLAGARRDGLDAEVVHLVQLLDRSYASSD